MFVQRRFYKKWSYTLLPPLKVGQTKVSQKLQIHGHKTKPVTKAPPRFFEMKTKIGDI